MNKKYFWKNNNKIVQFDLKEQYDEAAKLQFYQIFERGARTIITHDGTIDVRFDEQKKIVKMNITDKFMRNESYTILIDNTNKYEEITAKEKKYLPLVIQEKPGQIKKGYKVIIEGIIYTYKQSIEERKIDYYSSKIIAKAKQEQISKIRQERPYIFSKNYIQYDQFLKNVITSNTLIEEDNSLDKIQLAYHLIQNNWLKWNTPIYQLSPDFCKGAIECNVSKKSWLFKELTEEDEFTILIPKEAQIISPNNSQVDLIWLKTIYNSTNEANYKVEIEGKKKQNWNIPPQTIEVIVITMDREERIYGFIENYPNLKKAEKNVEENFITKIANIALNALLFIHYDQKNVSGKPTKNNISENNNKEKSENWKPRTINVKNTITTTKKSTLTNQTTSRKSPRAHWRTWHWKSVRYGKGRKNTKQVRIESTYISGK